MLCEQPISINGILAGCGQCLQCRINKQREWVHRLILEASLHDHNAFVTLTYSDEYLPRLADGKATLAPIDMTNFLKRLREKLKPSKIRYFYVGEYGDISQRPHYHMALFGYSSCEKGRSSFGRRGTCCAQCDRILETWSKGIVDLGTLTPESAAYISGYVTKKMTSKDDNRLHGRHPEYSRMSRRPGIGHDAMYDVASTLLTYGLESQTDVPVSLRHGRRSLPLGRYLRQNLRHLLGREKNAPKETLEKIKDDLQSLREIAFESSQSFSKTVVEQSKGKRLRVEAKRKLYRKEKKL